MRWLITMTLISISAVVLDPSIWEELNVVAPEERKIINRVSFTTNCIVSIGLISAYFLGALFEFFESNSKTIPAGNFRRGLLFGVFSLRLFLYNPNKIEYPAPAYPPPWPTLLFAPLITLFFCMRDLDVVIASHCQLCSKMVRAYNAG